MELNSIENKRDGLFKILLLINLAAIGVWVVGQNINVYRYAVVGAIFEILWLPVIGAIILMPIISFYFWSKDAFKATSKFMYLFLWSGLSIVVLYILTRA